MFASASREYAGILALSCSRVGISEMGHILRWTPNQLRHNRATEIRNRYGLEAAQTILGHSHADVTQIYAERDFELARQIMRDVG